MLYRLVTIILLLVVIANFAYRIDLRKSPHELVGELMYFPSGIALRALSLGFYAPLADIVWLRFIQYYGEHRLTDAKFELMHHILDILTTLDDRFIPAYTLGALMLTHDAHQPEQAKKLLKKGIHECPDICPGKWRILFTYGFIHYAFLSDFNIAHTYLRLASLDPDAPDFTKRWAAFILYKKTGDLETSRALWIDLYNNSKSVRERAIAKYYIDKIRMLLDIELLNTRVAEFTRKHGRLPINLSELVTYHMIDAIPKEPHGGMYVLKGGKVYSTWEQR